MELKLIGVELDGFQQKTTNEQRSRGDLESVKEMPIFTMAAGATDVSGLGSVVPSPRDAIAREPQLSNAWTLPTLFLFSSHRSQQPHPQLDWHICRYINHYNVSLKLPLIRGRVEDHAMHFPRLEAIIYENTSRARTLSTNIVRCDLHQE